MSTKTVQGTCILLYCYILVIIAFPARRIRLRQIGGSIMNDIVLPLGTYVFSSRVQQTATCSPPYKASRVPHVISCADVPIYKTIGDVIFDKYCQKVSGKYSRCYEARWFFLGGRLAPYNTTHHPLFGTLTTSAAVIRIRMENDGKKNTISNKSQRSL